MGLGNSSTGPSRFASATGASELRLPMTGSLLVFSLCCLAQFLLENDALTLDIAARVTGPVAAKRKPRNYGLAAGQCGRLPLARVPGKSAAVLRRVRFNPNPKRPSSCISRERA